MSKNSLNMVSLEGDLQNYYTDSTKIDQSIHVANGVFVCATSTQKQRNSVESFNFNLLDIKTKKNNKTRRFI